MCRGLRVALGMVPLIAGMNVSTAEVLETKVVCQEPGRYLGWPTICRRANGELLVVFSGDRDSHICPWGKVQMVRSSDDGKTWSGPATIQDSILDDRDAGIIELADGSLLLNWFTSIAFYAYTKTVAPDSRTHQAEYVRHYQKLRKDDVNAALGYWVARSTDGGRTWLKPVRTNGQLPHGMTQLKDGRLLAVSRFSENVGTSLPDSPWSKLKGDHILCEESTDLGQSWRVISELQPAGDIKLSNLHEPHMVELSDGRLLAQIRWHKRPGMGLMQSESSDGGKTWTRMTPTPMIGFPSHLLLLADGRVLSVYGNRESGHFGEYACLSSDGGRTWDVKNEICLCRHFNGDLGYPSSAQLADGSIITVYYQAPAIDQLPAVMMTHWRPAK